MTNKFKKYYKPNRPVKGACSKDLWHFYHMLRDDSCITYNFYHEGEEDPAEQVTIWKGNTETSSDVPEYITEEEGKERLYNIIKWYGFDSYRINLQWNYGFGNSVVVDVYRPADIS